MTSRITSKGQVTIPKAIRDRLGVAPRDRVEFVFEKGRVVLRPVKTLRDFRGAVRALPKVSFAQERAGAKAAVGRRVTEEQE